MLLPVICDGGAEHGELVLERELDDLLKYFIVVLFTKYHIDELSIDLNKIAC